MKKFILVSLFPVFIFPIHQQGKITTRAGSNLPKQASVQHQKEVLKIKLFNNDTIKAVIKMTGFGYDILRNGVPYIHQPNIPAVAGNTGFSSVQHAKETAKFVVYKIQHHMLPPTVSIQELDSLGVFK